MTSPGKGQFFGTATASTLSVGSSTITVNTFLLTDDTTPVAGTIVVTGNHDGTDTATINDSPNTNTLTAGGSMAQFKTAIASQTTINKFGSVTVNDQNGTNDTVHKDAIDFTLATVGNWTNI